MYKGALQMSHKLRAKRILHLGNDISTPPDSYLSPLQEKIHREIINSEPKRLLGSAAEFIEMTGLSEFSITASDVALLRRELTASDLSIFHDLLRRADYIGRLRRLHEMASIFMRGLPDIEESSGQHWLLGACTIFPLSAYFAGSYLEGDIPSELSNSDGKDAIICRFLPALLYALAKETYAEVKTDDNNRDQERKSRLEEGLRLLSPSLRELANSKARKDVNLTAVKNLYSRTFGEVFASALITIPSNKASTMTFGVEEKAQLLFVAEYCARNLGCAIRAIEEYDILSGATGAKSMIPSPSIFLALLRRETVRTKDIEKAILAAESKLNNQAFVYYTEAARPLSRIPLKTRPQMVRYLGRIKKSIDERHSGFQVEQIPGALRAELSQFLAMSK